MWNWMRKSDRNNDSDLESFSSKSRRSVLYVCPDCELEKRENTISVCLKCELEKIEAIRKIQTQYDFCKDYMMIFNEDNCDDDDYDRESYKKDESEKYSRISLTLGNSREEFSKSKFSSEDKQDKFSNENFGDDNDALEREVSPKNEYETFLVNNDEPLPSHDTFELYRENSEEKSCSSVVKSRNENEEKSESDLDPYLCDLCGWEHITDRKVFDYLQSLEDKKCCLKELKQLKEQRRLCFREEYRKKLRCEALLREEMNDVDEMCHLEKRVQERKLKEAEDDREKYLQKEKERRLSWVKCKNEKEKHCQSFTQKMTSEDEYDNN